ncbi:MAG: hypothetical protein ACRC8I_12065, partial [Plesiomonas shigelloides]
MHIKPASRWLFFYPLPDLRYNCRLFSVLAVRGTWRIMHDHRFKQAHREARWAFWLTLAYLVCWAVA